MSQNPLRVVIAEDEALIRLDLKEMLEEEGYSVVAEAGDGESAVERVTALRPDLAILDIKDQQVGPQAFGKLDRLLPVGGLPGYLVAFLLEHLLQVEPDQRLIFGDHNADRSLAHSHERTQSGRFTSAAPLPQQGKVAARPR